MKKEYIKPTASALPLAAECMIATSIDIVEDSTSGSIGDDGEWYTEQESFDKAPWEE
jgi:hypothetical protein